MKNCENVINYDNTSLRTFSSQNALKIEVVTSLGEANFLTTQTKMVIQVPCHFSLLFDRTFVAINLNFLFLFFFFLQETIVKMQTLLWTTHLSKFCLMKWSKKFKKCHVESFTIKEACFLRNHVPKFKVFVKSDNFYATLWRFCCHIWGAVSIYNVQIRFLNVVRIAIWKFLFASLQILVILPA